VFGCPEPAVFVSPQVPVTLAAFTPVPVVVIASVVPPLNGTAALKNPVVHTDPATPLIVTVPGPVSDPVTATAPPGFSVVIWLSAFIP
jgi:hypothetical protein